MADETEKITYEIVIDDSKATASGNKVADTFANIEGASKKSASALKDHSDVVDKLVPGLGGMVNGISSATKASLAFIATPIGAVIAALGVAVASVTAYFKSSEEAENKLTVVTKTLSAVFEQLMNFAEDLGEMIVKAFEDPQKALIDFANLIKENIVNRFMGMLELIPKLGSAIGLLFEGKFVEAGKTAFDAVAKVTTGIADASNKIEGFIKKVGDAVDAGITAGQRLANIQAEIDKKQRQLIEDRAKTDIEVIKLREKAVQEEGETKKKTIQEAIDLEVALSNKELQLAKLRQEQAVLEVKNNGDTKEALTKLAEANAAVTNAEATRYQNTLRFHKEIEAITNAELSAEKAAQDKFDKIVSDGLKKQQEEREKAEKKELEDQQKADDEAFKQLVDSENAKAQAEIDAATKAANAKKKLEKEVLADKQKSTREGLAILQVGQNVLQAIFGDNKHLAAANAIINGIKGYMQTVGEFGIPLGPILGGASLVAGAASAAKIEGVQFAGGGLSGTRVRAGMGKSVYRSNGDNILATVRTGEVILNEQQQAALGGARTFAAIGIPGFAGGGITDSQLTYAMNNSSIDAQINSDRQFDRMISKINSIQPVAVIEEFENTMNRRIQIRDTANL